MPIYAYLCEDDHLHEFERPIGTAQRMCRCHCGKTARLVIGHGVNIAPSALESKGAQVREVDAREARWDKDMPAYRRMRLKGMQPPQIDGAAALEDKVADQRDVQYQHAYSEGATREQITESMERAEQMVADAKAESA